MLNSYYNDLGISLNLPFKGRQLYMHTFEWNRPTMPLGFEDYIPILKQIASVGPRKMPKVGHVTVDEKVIKAGMSQRRPGPHVDGCFVPSKMSWSHDGGGGWLHTCNDIRRGPPRMAVVVAASVPGCRVWVGKFDGQPKSDGDLSHIQDQLGEGELLPANRAYYLSADCVHESVIFNQPTQRTFLRIALEP